MKTKVEPTVEKWEKTILESYLKMCVRGVHKKNGAVILQTAPTWVRTVVVPLLSHSVQEAEKRGYWRACKDKDEAIRLSNEEIEPRIKKLIQEAKAERYKQGGLDCISMIAENGEMPCEPLTWPCDICHRVRPDKNISVVSYKIQKLTGAVRNLKYCNDNRQCYEVAMRRAKDGQV